VDIDLDVPADLATVVDPRVVERVITNLLANAVRYGRPPISISARQCDRHLRVAVSDAGTGVPEELRERLFDRFVRGEKGSGSGSGLGLAIARSHPSNSEEAIQRNLAFFSQWKPPDGFEFKGFWGFADGSGGVSIVETDSAATIAKATAPFAPWLRFSTTPILPVEEASAIAGEAAAARASLGG
jgi:hypothetical protein